MNAHLTRSIVTLTLASILLAIGTLLLSIMVGPRPDWPAVRQASDAEVDGNVPPSRLLPTQSLPTIQQAPVDRNLKELYQLLQEQEQSQDAISVGVEEAMTGQVFSKRADIALSMLRTNPHRSLLGGVVSQAGQSRIGKSSRRCSCWP